jgi:tetratricopeptide (TPR) repeat protein
VATRGLLLRRDRPDEPITLFAEAARLAPRSAEAQYRWGRALAAAGRYDAAISHFAAALALDPHYEAAQAGLDECRRRRRGLSGAPAMPDTQL